MKSLFLIFLLPIFSFASWKEDLKNLVDINTESTNVQGLKLGRKLISEWAYDLGLTVEEKQSGSTGHSLLVIKEKNASPLISLVGHLDTVFVESFPYYEDKNHIYGPGVIDMKGGIVLLFQLMRRLKNDRLSHLVQILINDDEELGSPFTSNFMDTEVKKSSFALIFEPGLDQGELVSSHAGVQWLELEVQGKAAHAGKEPEKGINACLELSHKIIALSQVELSSDVRVNVGTLEGGTKPNVVCERASTKIDIRYGREQNLINLQSELHTIATKQYTYNSHIKKGPMGFLTTVAKFPSLEIEKTQFLVKLATEISPDIKFKSVNFGTDGGHISQVVQSVLVGLGPFGAGMHTKEEYMKISSFSERLEFSLEIIGKILERNNL